MKKIILILTFTSIFIIALFMLGCESAYVKGAKLYIGQSNFEKAREQLNKNAEVYPNDPVSYYWLGIIDGQDGKWDNMLEDFKKCLSISNKFQKEIENMKQQYFNDFLNQGVTKYNDAVKLFKDRNAIEDSIRKSLPGNTNYNDAAKLFKDKQFNEEEIKKVLPGITNYNDINKLFKDLGSIEDDVKKILNQVIATQEVALKIYPTNDKPGEVLSRAFLLLGERDRAREVFEGLLKDNPSHEVSLSMLGTMYFEDGINKNDKESLKRSVELNEKLVSFRPESPKALRSLALSYYQLGDTLKALSVFQTAMNKNPNDIDLILNYGKILYETGKKEEAESYFKKSLEISPDNKPALRTLARFYVIDLRDFIRGLEVLNRLVQLETDSPEIWELIGICQANLQNKDGAEEAFKKAESLRKTTP